MAMAMAIEQKQLPNDTKILIVGLGLIGGSYAMAVGFVLILAMRLLAAKYHWSLPRA